MAHVATLIGGSGFVGGALTEALAAAGWRVRVAARRPQRARRLQPLGRLGQIVPVAADLARPASLARAVEGADAVVNLVGILRPGPGGGFAAVHAEGAARVAAAAREAGARVFVQVSALGADRASASAYGRSKAEGETRAAEAFPGAILVRPSLIFGPQDSFTNRFAALIAALPVVPVIAPNTRFQPVHVEDVARAMVALIERGMAPAPQAGAAQTPPTQGVWELGGPEVWTMRRIFEWLNEVTRRRRLLIDLPDAGARTLAALGFLPGAPLTIDQYRMLARDNVLSGEHPGLAELGIAPASMAALAPAWLVRYRRGGRFAS